MSTTVFPPEAADPGSRGWFRSAGGYAGYVEAPVEWMGTNVQVCGLWPHVRGIGHPIVGVPIGVGLHTGAAVCCDPLSWFKRGEIRNPGAFILGLTAVGKSTLVATMALGLAASNVKLIALGDLKPDYADLTRALGGQVIKLGRGQGSLNMLDPGSLFTVAESFAGADPQLARQVQAEAIGRAKDLTVTLMQMYRRHPFTADDEQVLRTAVQLLLERPHREAPVLEDLRKLVADGPSELRHQTLSFTEGDEAYRRATHELQRSLAGFAGSDFGQSFGRDTTEEFDLDGPAVCVDISSLGGAASDSRLLDAVLLSTWAVGFAGIQGRHLLADHGRMPRAEYMVVMDEILEGAPFIGWNGRSRRRGDSAEPYRGRRELLPVAQLR